MKLSYVFAQLASGELNSLSCVDSTTATVKPTKYASLVGLINSGLIDLHTRFKLKIGKVVVPILPDQEVYRLEKVVPGTQSRFLQVHAITDNFGRSLGMNDFTNHRSVHFTNKTEMHVPHFLRNDDKVTEITVQYRAMPKPLGMCDDSIDPECMDVDLDYAYCWALCLFIASRAHQPVGLQDGTHASNVYVGLYNAECNRLTETNLELDYQTQGQDIRRAGWA